jgi:serine/threonine-protein kinase
MSPEQARGQPADKRSDVWAFGGVLYEMLSGERTFKGDDVADTLAAVLRQDVDWTALPESTPASVRRLTARCLDRDVRRRLRDIGEARIVLEDPAARSTADTGSLSVPPRLAPVWRRAIPFVVSALIAMMAAAAAWHLKAVTPLSVTRLEYRLPQEQSFTGLGRRVVDVSPDGTQIVYVANGRLYLRLLSVAEAKPIQGTEVYQAVTNPVFSPDGRFIAFHATSDGTLKSIAAVGGAAVTLCAAENPVGMSWGREGILFADRANGIRRVSPNGGTPDLLVKLRDGEISRSPQMLPGGRAVLFTLGTGTGPNEWDDAHVVVHSLATQERTTVARGSDARYLPTGHVVYVVGGTMFAVPFDPHTLQVGTAGAVVAGVLRSNTYANYSVAQNGTLVYLSGPPSTSGQTEIVMTDRRQILEALRLPPGSYMTPRVAADGRHIAFVLDDGKEANVYTYELSGKSGMQRLTFGGNNRFPIWTANNRIAFQSDRDGDLAIFWQSDAGGRAERLTTPEHGTSHVPQSWSPDGNTFLFSVLKGSDQSLWTYSMPDRKATPFGGVHSSTPIGAEFSPNGRWVVYSSTQGSRAMVYVQAFPASESHYELPVPTYELASQPLWSADGHELFYNPAPGRLAWIGVTTEPTFRFGNTESGARPFQTGPPSVVRAFDIARRGKFEGKFVGLAPDGQTQSGTPTVAHIQVVLNWFEELRAVWPSAK